MDTKFEADYANFLIVAWSRGLLEGREHGSQEYTSRVARARRTFAERYAQINGGHNPLLPAATTLPSPQPSDIRTGSEIQGLCQIVANSTVLSSMALHLAESSAPPSTVGATSCGSADAVAHIQATAHANLGWLADQISDEDVESGPLASMLDNAILMRTASQLFENPDFHKIVASPGAMSMVRAVLQQPDGLSGLASVIQPPREPNPKPSQ